jgi:hypothetical protein
MHKDNLLGNMVVMLIILIKRSLDKEYFVYHSISITHSQKATFCNRDTMNSPFLFKRNQVNRCNSTTSSFSSLSPPDYYGRDKSKKWSHSFHETAEKDPSWLGLRFRTSSHSNRNKNQFQSEHWTSFHKKFHSSASQPNAGPPSKGRRVMRWIAKKLLEEGDEPKKSARRGRGFFEDVSTNHFDCCEDPIYFY